MGITQNSQTLFHPLSSFLSFEKIRSLYLRSIQQTAPTHLLHRRRDHKKYRSAEGTLIHDGYNACCKRGKYQHITQYVEEDVALGDSDILGLGRGHLQGHVLTSVAGHSVTGRNVRKNESRLPREPGAAVFE